MEYYRIRKVEAEIGFVIHFEDHKALITCRRQMIKFHFQLKEV